MPDPTKAGDNARIEQEIIRDLNNIGFPDDLSKWKSAPAIIDPDGTTLRILGHPVMEAWEKPYMRKLASIATSHAAGGRVLELGFGLGISACFIQSSKIAEHIIIEMNASIAEHARRFAAEKSQQVTIIEGLWQDITPRLETSSFQGILFDTYPMNEEEVDTIFYPFLEHAFRLLSPGGRLTYYSDESDGFSPYHLAALKGAGFHKIDGEVITISPPTDCRYWRQKTILAPIIER